MNNKKILKFKSQNLWILENNTYVDIALKIKSTVLSKEEIEKL